MSPLRQTALLATLSLALCATPANALITTGVQSPLPQQLAPVLPQQPDDQSSLLQSLRQEVAQHPSDYITFETETAAHQFLSEHMDALRETDHTMMLRGIIGYWHGRTLAILPSLAGRYF